MKRIWNDVPLQSLLYTVPGDTLIRIKDIKHHPAFVDKNNPDNYTVVYEGEAKGFSGSQYWKAGASKIVDTEIITSAYGNGTGVWLVLSICTSEDTY